MCDTDSRPPARPHVHYGRRRRAAREASQGGEGRHAGGGALSFHDCRPAARGVLGRWPGRSRWPPRVHVFGPCVRAVRAERERVFCTRAPPRYPRARACAPALMCVSANAGLKKELIARLAELDGEDVEGHPSPELAARSSPKAPRALSRSAQRALWLQPARMRYACPARARTVVLLRPGDCLPLCSVLRSCRDRASASPRASPRKAALTSPRKGAPASPRAAASPGPAPALKGRLADRARALARAGQGAGEAKEEDGEESAEESGKEEAASESAEEEEDASEEDEDSADSDDDEEDEEEGEEDDAPAAASASAGEKAPETLPSAKQVLKKLSFFRKGSGGGGGGLVGRKGSGGAGRGIGAGLGGVVARSLRDVELTGGDAKPSSMWAASSAHALYVGVFVGCLCVFLVCLMTCCLLGVSACPLCV